MTGIGNAISGILPANGRMTPSMIEKRRKLADAQLQAGLDFSPVGSWTQGLARMANAGIGAYSIRKGEDAERSGMASAREKLMRALSGNMDDATMMDAINDPFMSSAGQGLLSKQWDQAHETPDPNKALNQSILQNQVDQIDHQKAYRNSLPPDQQLLYDRDPKAYVEFDNKKREADLNVGIFDGSNGQPAAGTAQPIPQPMQQPTEPLPVAGGPGSDPNMPMSPVSPMAAPLNAVSPPNAASPSEIPPEIMTKARIIARKDPNAAIMFLEEYKKTAASQKATQEQTAFTQKNATIDNIANVRKEIHQLPSYKSLTNAIPIYGSMVEASMRDTKPADLDLVYGLAKIFDPTSVVREGETVMVRDTASLPDWLQGAINGVNGGAKLQKATRIALMTEAKTRMDQYRSAFDSNVQQYKGIAGRNGWNEADILPSFGAQPNFPNIPDMGVDIFPPEGSGAAVPSNDLFTKYGIKKVN